MNYYTKNDISNLRFGYWVLAERLKCHNQAIKHLEHLLRVSQNKVLRKYWIC